MANLSANAAQLSTIGVAVINVLMTIVAGFVVDRAGRRTLQLVGLIGAFLSTVVLVLCLVFEKSVPQLAGVSIASVCVFMVFFASGPGTISWLMVAEMFEQGPRNAAASAAFIVNWFSLFICALFYPLVQEAIGVYSFAPFSVMLFVFIVFTYFYVPETKGKSILEITNMFKELTQNRIPQSENEKTGLLRWISQK